MTATTSETPAAGTTDRGEPILRLVNLTKRFPIKAGLLRRTIGHVHAVTDVSLDLYDNETLGVVGESGCGKTTLGRTLLRLIEPDSGQIVYCGDDITKANKKRMRELRKELQIVFQDPYASLNPRMPIRDIVGEPLSVHGVHKKERAKRVGDLLRAVGLLPEHGNRYPHEFSGGQRQRIGIARALALDPNVVVLDEPVSALDVSIQAEIMRLLIDLRERLGLSYLFIAHDLAVVRQLADRVAVMYLGKIVEIGPAERVYDSPQHPYTQALLSAVPIPDPEVQRTRRRIMLTGELPSPIDPPSGCRFRTRCWRAEQRCTDTEPVLTADTDEHSVACHFPGADRLTAAEQHV